MATFVIKVHARLALVREADVIQVPQIGSHDPIKPWRNVRLGHGEDVFIVQLV